MTTISKKMLALAPGFDPERVFESELVQEGITDFVREYRFIPERKWLADFAWPDKKIILEIEGGIWQQTSQGFSKGHAHPVRFLQDIEKYNEMALHGWCLLRVTPEQVHTGYARQVVKRALQMAEDSPLIPALSPDMVSPRPAQHGQAEVERQLADFRAKGMLD